MSPQCRSPHVVGFLFCLRLLPLHSFAEALHSELEVSGVGVTCVMPGATRTSFQDNSGSAKALVWQLPLFSMEADEVGQTRLDWHLPFSDHGSEAAFDGFDIDLGVVLVDRPVFAAESAVSLGRAALSRRCSEEFG